MQVEDLDLENPIAVFQLLNETRPDFICNFASQNSIGFTWGNPGIAVDTNIKGSINLLEAARQLDLPAERCLALDDVAEALSGARQAGMLAVGVPDPCSSSRQALEQAACLVAENLDQLAGILVFPQD